jgi:hypothetical protein
MVEWFFFIRKFFRLNQDLPDLRMKRFFLLLLKSFDQINLDSYKKWLSDNFCGDDLI